VIQFAATGPASIVAVDNGNMMDHDPFQATERKLYDGNAVALVRATGTSGRITVTASADGIPTATLTLTAAPVDKEDPQLPRLRTRPGLLNLDRGPLPLSNSL